MWKRYDDLNANERADVIAVFSGDAFVMGAKNVDEVRRQYGYWCDGYGIVRRKAHLITNWQAETLY